MGGSASVARPTTRFKKPPIPVEQQKKDQTQASEGLILFVILLCFFLSFLCFLSLIENLNKST
jgi:hypothetical protein